VDVIPLINWNMDTIVFDIETKNTFADVGGDRNIDKLDVSVVCIYSYEKDAYTCFEEHEFSALGDILQRAHLLVGFSSKRFDVPVLNKYFKFNLAAIPHYDILEEIENAWGRRISLDLLGEANVNAKKTGHGLDAIDWYRNGEMDKLKEYCTQDVKITKDIFDLIRERGYLWIPQRNSPEMARVLLPYKEEEPNPQASLW
jgi:DEAD/DEAH box helicase domain-containing protein